MRGGLNIALRLGRGHFGLEPGGHAEVVVADEGDLALGQPQRDPYVVSAAERETRQGKLEVFGKHAHDRDWFAVKVDHATRNRRIAAEPFLPKLVTDDCDATTRAVLRFAERAANDWRHAEDGKDLR